MRRVALLLLLLAAPVAGQGARTPGGAGMDEAGTDRDRAESLKILMGAGGFLGTGDLMWGEGTYTGAITAEVAVRVGKVFVSVEREWGRVYGTDRRAIPPGTEYFPSLADQLLGTRLNAGNSRGDWAGRIGWTLPEAAWVTLYAGLGRGTGRTPGDIRYESRFRLLGARLPLGDGFAISAEARLRTERSLEWWSGPTWRGHELRLGAVWLPVRLIPSF